MALFAEEIDCREEIEEMLWQNKDFYMYFNNLTDTEFKAWIYRFVAADLGYGLRDVVNYLLTEYLFDLEKTSVRYQLALSVYPGIRPYLEQWTARRERINKKQTQNLMLV